MYPFIFYSIKSNPFFSIQHQQLPGKKNARISNVREVIRECAGYAPYERRVMELIKMGTAQSFKRALKFSKLRLGTHKRGKAKRQDMEAQIAWLKNRAAEERK